MSAICPLYEYYICNDIFILVVLILNYKQTNTFFGNLSLLIVKIFEHNEANNSGLRESFKHRVNYFF